jgi:hypothetical protein
VTGGWRKPRNEQRALKSSSSIVIIMKFKKMRRAGHVARMGAKRKGIGYWKESQRERDK